MSENHQYKEADENGNIHRICSSIRSMEISIESH
jgi:hypothetical protein